MSRPEVGPFPTENMPPFSHEYFDLVAYQHLVSIDDVGRKIAVRLDIYNNGNVSTPIPCRVEVSLSVYEAGIFIEGSVQVFEVPSIPPFSHHFTNFNIKNLYYFEETGRYYLLDSNVDTMDQLQEFKGNNQKHEARYIYNSRLKDKKPPFEINYEPKRSKE